MNNHYMKVKQALETKQISGQELTRLNIYHDDACALLNRRGPCNCDPMIKVETKESKQHEGH